MSLMFDAYDDEAVAGNRMATGGVIVFDEVTPPLPEQRICYCRRCFLHDDPGGCVA